MVVVVVVVGQHRVAMGERCPASYLAELMLQIDLTTTYLVP